VNPAILKRADPSSLPPVHQAICVAEDRPSDEIVARLCIASARQSNPEVPIIAYLPRPSDATRRWLSSQSMVELIRTPLAGSYGWNVKPHALLAVLDRGFDVAWWIDSDVLVRRSLAANYGSIERDVLLVTEEALSANYRDGGMRARHWGFEVARDFRFTLNSGVMRVSAAHRTLLEKWQVLLESPEYRAAQSLDWTVRPAHLKGDQDVLTALLCGADFASVSTHVLRRGPDIVQYLGPFCYTLRERVGNLFDGGPTFIHSQGFKPWRNALWDDRPWITRAYYRLLSDTSAYAFEARRLCSAVGDDLPWAKAQTLLGKLLRMVGFGNRMLTGLPLACAGDVVRAWRRIASAN
jgi:hypothetical protein